MPVKKERCISIVVLLFRHICLVVGTYLFCGKGGIKMPVNSFLDYPMTWRPQKQSLKRPIYRSLADQLEADIRAGILAPGTKLPPQRELADFLDINFTTVTRTYKLCEMRGLVYAKTGRGTFVSRHAAQPITISAVQAPHACIDLAFVASFEQCNYMVTDAVRKVTEKKYFEKLLDYGDPSGMPHHKKAGIRWMQQFGMTAEEEQTAVVSGALNAVALTFFALFEAGDRIAVDSYTFTNFIELAKLYHLHLTPVAGDLEGMLPEELDMQCRRNRVKGIFLMPSCSNPTTVTMTEERKRELATVIKKHRLILIEDDICAFLTAGVLEDDRGPVSRFVREQSVYICSTSKAICSGLRIAYLVFGEKFRDDILRAVYNVNVKTSALNAEIVTELLMSGKADEIIAEKRRLAKEANQLFHRYFPEAPPSGHPLSFFRWLPITGRERGLTAEKKYEKAGVRVYHSDRFLSGEASEDQYLRISLATADSLEQLRFGLDILRRALDEQ